MQQSAIRVMYPFEGRGALNYDPVYCERIGGYYQVAAAPALAGGLAAGDIVLLKEVDGHYLIDTVVSSAGTRPSTFESS